VPPYHHDAVDPEGAEAALETVAGGTGLIAAADLLGALPVQATGETTDGFGAVGFGPLDRLPIVRWEKSDLDRVLVNVRPTNVVALLTTGSFRLRLWRRWR
jgi:hypothetical protein